MANLAAVPDITRMWFVLNMSASQLHRMIVYFVPHVSQLPIAHVAITSNPSFLQDLDPNQIIR